MVLQDVDDLQTGVPELLLQDECLHTSAIPGDDALLCAASGSGAGICN